MPVTFFENIGDFTKTLPLASDKRDASNGRSWDGGQTYAQALANLKTGRLDALRASDKLLEQIDEAGIEIEMPVLEVARVGFTPCVPAFIAGSPDAMLCMQETLVDGPPIRIFVGICYSAGVTSERAHKRGIAMLALARKLSQIRATEIHVFADLDGNRKDDTGACGIPVIKLETSPLDTATASYAITDIGFLRKLCFAWGEEYHGFSGSWAWFKDPSTESYKKELTRVLGATPNDLVLPGGYLYDELLDKPVEWVNNEIKKFLLHNASNKDNS